MQKLVWQNANGDEINLTGGNYGITEWEGFSNASLNIQNQQVPFQDGGVYLDSLINQRELSVTLKMQDNGNLEERYRMRRELIHILDPKLGEGYLIYTNDFISKRIKCVPQIPLFETHNSDTRGTPKASLAWTACEPYWEDLDETVVIFTNSETKEITNNGDIKTQIKARITDIENENFSIDNRTSEQNITSNCELNGSVSINTGMGQKDIVLEEPRFGDLYGGLGNGGVVVDNSLIIVGGMVVKINTKTYKRESLVTNLNVILNDIAYSPTLRLYIAISNTQIFSSNDLINWTERSTGAAIQGDVVSWENNVFKTNAISGILTSVDGINWTQTTGSISKSKTQCQFKNIYYRVATVSNKSVIQQSLDGSVWATVYNENSINTLVVSENYLYAIGNSMTIIKTKNGTNWNLLYKGYNLQKSCMAFNKIYYYTDNNEILIFKDEKLNIIFTINEEISDIFFKNDRLLILTKTKIYLSTNGENFSAVRTLPYEVYYGNIFFNNDDEKYCVYFDGNVFLSSYNGYEWELEGFHNALPYERINTPYMAYFDGNYFIGCLALINDNYYRCIIKTSDLENFDTVYLETNTSNFIDINGMYADENYVVMYGAQKIVKSSDGVNFVSNMISQERRISNIKKIDNLYYITGSFPYFYETQDFSNLIQKVIPTVETRSFIGLDIISDTMYLYGIFEEINRSGFFGKNIPLVKNIINCLTNDSDMDFCLALGNNTIYFDGSNNSELKITFRQKYIGV